MAFGKTARTLVAGLYVLAMMFAAIIPTSPAMANSPSVSAAATDCGPGMDGMQHAAPLAKAVTGACDPSGHQSGAPCMIGGICADLPSGMVAHFPTAPVLPIGEQLFVASDEAMSGLDPDPGLRPPSLSA